MVPNRNHNKRQNYEQKKKNASALEHSHAVSRMELYSAVQRVQGTSVRVENMLPIEEVENDEWTIEDGSFDTNDGKTVIMQYLLNDNKQIFKMDDGRYVLEVENEDGTMD